VWVGVRAARDAAFQVFDKDLEHEDTKGSRSRWPFPFPGRTRRGVQGAHRTLKMPRIATTKTGLVLYLDGALAMPRPSRRAPSTVVRTASMP
jgi:hypothetical protein